MLREAAPQTQSELTIRRLGPADAGALDRLAQRDSAEVPEGTVYAIASSDGSLLAAISLESRAVVADPFLPTAAAAKLLRVFAGQLGKRRRHGRQPSPPLRAAVPRARSGAGAAVVGC